MTTAYTPERTTTRGQTVRLNNIEMHYEEYGTGKPLALLHGFGGWHRTGTPLLPSSQSAID